MVLVIPSTSDNVAFSIALSVLLLSVVLHPIVRWCFHRIRADMAWKSIEKQKPVEVTKYNIFSEALGDRGGWDTARVVTFMLAAFHVATWGLELSLDLALRTDGPVDLLNRPPPVVFRSQVLDPAHNLTDWIVEPIVEPPREGGSLNNFRGSLVDGNASTSYRVGDGIVLGNTIFAAWSPEASRIASGLFYDVDDGQALVSEVACSTPSRMGALYVSVAETSKWGDVTECESGPRLLNASEADRSSPPTILLNSTESVVHLIVEEESSYPSFLYSVWQPGDVRPQEEGGGMELNHVFYISSTTRLVEAIVSGVANGVLTGGGCVDLLTKYSVANSTYSLNGAQRVSPFGEHPRSSSVESLDQVEPIVAGVLVSNIGTVCGVMLIVVTGAAFAGCLLCHSRRSLDVYNRDQLIRAISLPSGEGADGKPAAIKIYVRQEQDNAFSIVISDDGVYRGCAGLKKRLTSNMNYDTAVAEQGQGSMRGRGSISRSGALPVGSRELTFDGVRPALGDLETQTQQRRPPASPARRAPTVVSLVASPVPVPRVGRAGSQRRLTLALADLHGSSSTTVATVAEDRDSLSREVSTAKPVQTPVGSARGSGLSSRKPMPSPAPAAE
eukprot:g14061.t1